MIKRIIWVCIFLFAVPVLGHVIGHVLRSITEARFADELARFTGRNSLSIASGLACPPQPFILDLFAPCVTLGHLDLLSAFSDRVAALTVFLLLVIGSAALFAYGNRGRLAAVFFPTILFVLVMLAGIILLQSVIFASTVYVVLYVLMQGAPIPGMLIGIAISQLIAMHVMAVAVLEVLKPEPLEIEGKSVSRSDQPRLWQFIDDVARRLDTSPPNSVVCGLPPAFFAVSGDAKIRGERGRLLPNTLYISLPMMRVMSHAELECVLGHELGHFIGEDRTYTSDFVSPYAATARSLEAIGDHGPIIALPALTVLALLLVAFGIARLAVSRKRELEADRFGIHASNVQSHMIALLRSAALSGLWHYVTADASKQGGVKNASTAFDATVADYVKSVDRTDLLSKIASMRTAHPIDTHPTIAERFRAQGQSLEGAEHLLDLPQDRSIALIDDAEALEESLTDQLGLAPREGQASQ